MPQNEFGQPVGIPVEVAKAPLPSSEPMVGQYCELQRLQAAAHGEQLFDAFARASDDADWTYLPYGPWQSREDFMQWLEKLDDLDDPMFFTVIDGRDGSCAGMASYMRIDRYAAAIEVGGIHFARSIQGTPVTTEAMYLMMRRIFETGYRRYEWKCDDLNAPSRAAAQRLGFTYEGTFRQATHYKGRSRDTAWFGLIDSDWPDTRDRFERWLAPTNFDADCRQLTSLR